MRALVYPERVKGDFWEEAPPEGRLDTKPRITWPLPSRTNQSRGEGRLINRHVQTSVVLRLLGLVEFKA